MGWGQLHRAVMLVLIGVIGGLAAVVSVGRSASAASEPLPGAHAVATAPKATARVQKVAAAASASTPQVTIDRVSYDYADVRLTVTNDVAFTTWADTNGHQQCPTSLQPGTYTISCRIFFSPSGSFDLRAAVNDSQGTVYGADNTVTPKADGDVPYFYSENHNPENDAGNDEGFSIYVDPEGVDTTWHIAYGTSPSLGSVTSDHLDQQAFPGYGAYYESAQILGPLPSTVYYYEFVGTNVHGTTTTPMQTFTSGPGPATTTATTQPTTTTHPPDEERPALSSTVLAAGVVGTPYRFALPLSKGSPPYTVTLNGPEDRTPPGLQLESNGVVDGTPQSDGQFSFNIGVYDQKYTPADGYASVFTLTISITRPSTTTVATTTTAPTTTTRAPSARAIFPNRKRTPGVTNPAVTQSTIKKTICVSGWTAKVRPPVSFTNALKLKQMKQYGEKGKPTIYEEDHFIPLELGGAPRNPKNLWPEPRSESKHSDPLETTLKHRVCTGKLTLAAARKQILVYKRTHG